MSTGDLDAMQKQYRDQLNALDYDEMILSGNRNRQQQHQQHQQQQQHEDYGLHMEDPRSSISPPLRNKFTTTASSTPPARSNSTPPGRNMYNEIDRQTELMMNQFGGFGLNDEVRLKFTFFFFVLFK